MAALVGSHNSRKKPPLGAPFAAPRAWQPRYPEDRGRGRRGAYALAIPPKSLASRADSRHVSLRLVLNNNTQGRAPQLVCAEKRRSPTSAPEKRMSASIEGPPPEVSKYGQALTGSDWPGLPLRIGHIPQEGTFEDLSSEVDSVLLWVGGPSDVTIEFEDEVASLRGQHGFHRTSGMVDLLPRSTRLVRVSWSGKASTCIGVNLPSPCLEALMESMTIGINPSKGPQFGLIDAHLVDMVHRLHEQAQGTEYWGAVYVQSLSLALASYVSARYGVGSKSEILLASRGLSTLQRKMIESFVESELPNNFGLVDLAKLVGYSPDHFSRLFKSTFEQSPHQYVLSRRVEKAKVLLKDHDVSIAAIAAACGFSNQGHLTSVFKQRTGMTPGRFRRS